MKSNFIETNASSLVLYGCKNSLISYINRPVFQWVAQVFHLSHPNWVSLYIFHIVLYKFPIALARKIFNENQLTECSLLWNHTRDFKIERATTDEWVKYEWNNHNVRNKNCIDYWKLTVALACGNSKKVFSFFSDVQLNLIKDTFDRTYQYVCLVCLSHQ